MKPREKTSVLRMTSMPVLVTLALLLLLLLGSIAVTATRAAGGLVGGSANPDSVLAEPRRGGAVIGLGLGAA